MKQLILVPAISVILHSLTMSVTAQGASCKSEYDLCRRVHWNPNHTHYAMFGS